MRLVEDDLQAVTDQLQIELRVLIFFSSFIWVSFNFAWIELESVNFGIVEAVERRKLRFRCRMRHSEIERKKVMVDFRHFWKIWKSERRGRWIKSGTS
ncbi:hypothetical protein M5689_020596 [Euphorbia peplus]|nr:hypothetical protein M5689_020596 [Euphorbia peplus]